VLHQPSPSPFQQHKFLQQQLHQLQYLSRLQANNAADSIAVGGFP
jgi:hypothetical protein